MAAFNLHLSPAFNCKEVELPAPRQQSAWQVRERASPSELGSSAARVRSEHLKMQTPKKRYSPMASLHTGNLRPTLGRESTSPKASTLQQTEMAKEEAGTQQSNTSGIEIRTLRGCGLGIARYPDFVYNAEGGGGFGTAEELEDGRLAVEFDIEKLFIPPVGYKTTTFLGLPLPPFIRIDVIPEALRGFIDRKTGKVELDFSAKFLFSVGSLYRPPPLHVDTLLTTEQTQGRIRGGQGRRLDSEGHCRLVGVAPLVPINDAFMDAFLTLPTDCLASMAAKFTFSL